MLRGRSPGYPPQGANRTPPPPGMVFQTPIITNLLELFQSVDTNQSGQITVSELQAALAKGQYTQFNAETCRLMIGMFDKNNSGGIDTSEFEALWKYIEDWKGCFARFDKDRSGNIDADELLCALSTFGYNLSHDFAKLCVTVFDRTNSSSIQFDDFIQCCIMVKSLTDQFRSKDRKETGSLQIHYEEFLLMVLNSKNVV